MGVGIGTFLKCNRRVELADNNILQIGASLYGLVNIITREEYEKFTNKNNNEGKMQSSFVNKLNNQQLILRIKFFGG